MFSDETLRGAAHRPVTNDHPDEHVTSKNWKDYAVGQTGDEVTGEGIFIRVPLMVSIESAIIDIEAGKQELSAGVHLRPRFHRLVPRQRARPTTPFKRISGSTTLPSCRTAAPENGFASVTRAHGRS